MSFERVLDQRVPKRILSGALKNNLLASAYLFYGDRGTGKWAMALELAKAINCEKSQGEACDACASCLKIGKMGHPDVKMIFPVPSSKSDEKNQEETERFRRLKSENPYAIVKFEKNVNIPVEQIRAMQREIASRLDSPRYRLRSLRKSLWRSIIWTEKEPPITPMSAMEAMVGLWISCKARRKACDRMPSISLMQPPRAGPAGSFRRLTRCSGDGIETRSLRYSNSSSPFSGTCTW
jgi:DNA polymerase III delta prime subunit